MGENAWAEQKKKVPGLKNPGGYAAIVVSDHSAVTLDLRFDHRPKDYRTWRLDPLLLADGNFCTQISEAIDLFLKTNNTDGICPMLLWETLKAFIRVIISKIISYTSYINKKCGGRQKELEESIATLDQRYSSNQSPNLYKERLKLDLLTTREAERLLLRSRGTQYEFGDKASRLLAHQLKIKTASNQITQIRTNTSALTSDPVEINDVFKEFYSQLYTSESSNNEAHMSEFFTVLDVPMISEDNRQILDSPLQLNEITEAIKLMNNNKSPGPDGFPVEFFNIY